MRNSLKIVGNPYTNQLSYYFKNETGEWKVLSESSPLSRQFYTKTSIKDRAKEIVAKVDEVYNRKNRGIDLLFEGATGSFEILKETVKQYFPDRNICCQLGTTRTAVVGKACVGKTCLIEGLEGLSGHTYARTIAPGYIMYEDEEDHAQWFEVNGIDLGKDTMETAFQAVEELAEKGLSSVIYCISAMSGKMEEAEKEFILKMVEGTPEINVMVALTMCYKDDVQIIVDEIKKMTDQIKLVKTLAKTYTLRGKDENGAALTVEPFGLEEVSRYVFEGR